VQGHFAELDGFFGPDRARDLERRLRDLGKEAEIVIHPGVDHAFFNDTRPEVYDAEQAAAAWDATVAFLRANVT
jgi:carboxymethylenebutenolidase